MKPLYHNSYISSHILYSVHLSTSSENEIFKFSPAYLDNGLSIYNIDISQYRLLLGFFLLYTDRVPFELLDSAALV
jgi:hypothetical protein